jgi:hypothetical protein
MKKQILLLAMLICFIQGYTQQKSPDTPDSLYYRQQNYNSGKTAGWLLFGLGTLGFCIGAGNELSDFNLNLFDPNAYKERPSYTTLYVISGIAVVSGAALILVSKSKERKAQAATGFLFKMENSTQIVKGNLMKKSYPALAFRIKI